MTDSIFIHFGRDEAKVKSVNTASMAKGTRLTVVLEFTDSYALSRVIQALHEAQHPIKPPPAPAPAPSTKPKRAALPAPPLGLPYFGEEA